MASTRPGFVGSGGSIPGCRHCIRAFRTIVDEIAVRDRAGGPASAAPPRRRPTSPRDDGHAAVDDEVVASDERSIVGR